LWSRQGRPHSFARFSTPGERVFDVCSICSLLLLCCTCPDAPLTSHTAHDIHSPQSLFVDTRSPSHSFKHNTRPSLIAHNTHCLDVLLPITARPPAHTAADPRRQTTDAQDASHAQLTPQVGGAASALAQHLDLCRCHDQRRTNAGAALSCDVCNLDLQGRRQHRNMPEVHDCWQLDQHHHRCRRSVSPAMLCSMRPPNVSITVFPSSSLLSSSSSCTDASSESTLRKTVTTSTSRSTLVWTMCRPRAEGPRACPR
jgi:hypothetical protein